MNLFGKICEGIINEVDAKQAYERFYSSIPRDQYDAIVGGETNIDKFVQFILNAVRDDDYPVDRAVELLNNFKESDPLVRQNITNSFKQGEYDSPDEIAIDLEYLKNGGVVNKNKFAKEGLIVLAKDENWTITCTTNYLANSHYFGYTSWCTASDRAGRYDGYEMFIRYTDGGCHILIQATSNADKNKTYQMEIKRPSQKYSSFDYPDDDFFDQVCDKEDNSINGSRLVKETVGEILRNVLDDTEKMMFCLKKENEQREPEKVYQDKQDKIIRIKKRKLAEKLEKKRQKLRAEAEEKNKKLETNTDKYWDEIVENKLYEDLDFLQRAYDSSKKLNETENKEEEIEIVKNSNFVIAANKCTVLSLPDGSRVSKFKLILLDGPKWKLSEFWGNYDLRDCRLEYGLDFSHKTKMFVLVLMDAHLKITKLLAHSEDGFDCEETAAANIDGSLAGEDSVNRYFALRNFNGFDCILDAKTSEIYKYKEFDYDSWRRNSPIRVLNLMGKPFFISRCDGTGTPYCCIFINSPEDISVEYHSERFYTANSCSLLLDKETGMLQVVYDDNVNYSCIVPKDICEKTRGCWKSETVQYIFFNFKDNDELNVLYVDGDNSEFVFGKNYIDIDEYGYQGIFKANFKKGNKRYYIRYSCKTKTYELRDGGTGDLIDKCDKYGRTEKDILTDKNLKAWQDAGGHSPEEKAQMDAMWADRKAGTESDGSEAMKAWDDYDTKRYPEDSWYLNKSNARTLGKGDDYGKDHWEGRVGIKDPADWWSPNRSRTVHAADFDRDFYKVGTNGKPLEQPWRDEDEVPANFAEYPEEGELAEAINKIKSLFGRMGLLEG